MSQKMKNLPLFYKIYFLCLSVFIMFLIIFLIFLNSFITSYNEGIPETVSERFFNDVFLKLDTEKIIEMANISPSEFETQEDLNDFLNKTLSSNLSYTSISSDGDDRKYIVKSGEYKCASFTLTPDEKGDYHPSSLSLHLPKSASAVYKVLDSSTLYINGKAVGDEYITSREDHISAEYLPEGVNCPQWVIYSVEGITQEPKVSVIDRNGATPELYESDGILTEEIVYDTEEKEITDRILEGAKKYAICMQDDAPKSAVYPYFEKGTELYNDIRSVENTFVWEHSGYAIEDEKVSEFFRYDENTVSVRISFTHVLKKSGRQDYRDITDITYYARNIDGKYMIFARHNKI